MSSPIPSPNSSRLLGLFHIALWLVPITGAATYLFARTRMDSLVAAAVVWHVAAGALLGTPFVIGLIRRKSEPLVLRLGTVVALGTGLALIGTAAAGISVGRLPWLQAAHAWIGLALFAGLAAAGLSALMRRKVLGRTAATALTLATVGTAALAAVSYQAEDYFRTLMATNPRSSGNPLFPAGTVLEGASEWRQAADEATCGLSGCHPDVAGEHAQSRHARAVGSLDQAQSDQKQWCMGCHGTSGLLKNPQSGDPAPASVGCLSCHSMSQVPFAAGNGLARYAPPARYPLSGSKDRWGRWLHGFFLRVRPAPHTATLTPLRGNQTLDLSCQPCHRLAANVAQNGYKYLRYDNTWADWQAGPFSKESLHAFRSVPARRGCVDCHMPSRPNGRVDHACLAQKGSAAPNRDLRIEVFSLRRGSGSAGSEIVEAPLSERSVSILPGMEVTVDVLVENRGIGHSFPAATDSGRTVWLAFETFDSAGRSIHASPAQPEDSAGDRHSYGQLALDRSGRPLDPHEKGRMVASTYRRFIGAGEADVAHYRLTLPLDLRPGPLRIRVRLLRKPSAEEPPETLASHQVSVNVLKAGSPAPRRRSEFLDPAGASRFYSCGIALLVQGENGRARRMFEQAVRLAPKDPIYYIGIARAHLAEHDLLSAEANLQNALRLQPGMPEARVWLGAVYREGGQYRKALDMLSPLTREYGRDRRLWMQIGLCRLQMGDSAGAERAFQALLEIDPDDAAAHYNLMQSYLRRRKLSLARREETVFRALQEDEPLRAILDPFYAANPGAQRESLPVHEHMLRPLKGGLR